MVLLLQVLVGQICTEKAKSARVWWACIKLIISFNLNARPKIKISTAAAAANGIEQVSSSIGSRRAGKQLLREFGNCTYSCVQVKL